MYRKYKCGNFKFFNQFHKIHFIKQIFILNTLRIYFTAKLNCVLHFAKLHLRSFFCALCSFRAIQRKNSGRPYCCLDVILQFSDAGKMKIWQIKFFISLIKCIYWCSWLYLSRFFSLIVILYNFYCNLSFYVKSFMDMKFIFILGFIFSFCYIIFGTTLFANDYYIIIIIYNYYLTIYNFSPLFWW